MVSLDGVRVGDTVVPEMKADGAIMDTGTSLITTSMQDAAAINSVGPYCKCPSLQTGTVRMKSRICARHASYEYFCKSQI